MTKTEAPQTNNTSGSNTNVYFSNYVEMEWKDGKRIPRSIRINDKLYEEFKPISKALYGSVCRPVECFMAAVVFAARQKVHFSNTQQPIQIGKIVIERNLRPRRMLEVVDVDSSLEMCLYCDWKKRAVGKFRFLRTGEVYGLCSFHAEHLLAAGGWEVV